MPLGAGWVSRPLDNQQPHDLEAGASSASSRSSASVPLDLTRRTSGSLASARSIARTVSRVGIASASLALNLAKVVQDDRKKMIVNNMLRQMAVQQALQVVNLERRATPTNSPAIGGEPKPGRAVSHRQSQHRDAMLLSEREQVLAQVEKRFKGHTPWTARALTLIQCVVLVSMMCSARLAPFGVGVAHTTTTVPLLTGTTDQLIQVPRNPYYGPRAEGLVSWGSKWSACMRGHVTVMALDHNTTQEETHYGCCVNDALECGMTDSVTCASLSGVFSVGQSCHNSTTCQTIKLRPCCFGIFGQCAQLSEQHCDVLGGVWNMNPSMLCSQSNCLAHQCGGSGLWSGGHPNQFYRFITAMFIHVGVIHFAMNAVAQYLLVSQVECVAGPARTLVIYLTSGAFGFLVSALFAADALSNGSSAAIYGMLGVEAVDLVQTWKLIDNRTSQVVGLVVKLVIFFAIGTLPYIDNFAHLGGFGFGVIAAMCWLPHISFGQRDRARKIAFKVLNWLLMMALVAGSLYKFYTSNETFCEWCKYLNCVPYTRSLCRGVGS